MYFFEENSSESSWILPDVNSSVAQVLILPLILTFLLSENVISTFLCSITDCFVLNLNFKESTLEDEGYQQPDDAVLSSTPKDDANDRVLKTDKSEKQEKLSLRTTKSRSMVIVDSGLVIFHNLYLNFLYKLETNLLFLLFNFFFSVTKDIKIMSSPKNWPQLFDGDMVRI